MLTRARLDPSDLVHSGLLRDKISELISFRSCRATSGRRLSLSSAFISVERIMLARLDPSTLVDSGLLRDKISEVISFRSCRATSGRRLSSGSAFVSPSSVLDRLDPSTLVDPASGSARLSSKNHRLASGSIQFDGGHACGTDTRGGARLDESRRVHWWRSLRALCQNASGFVGSRGSPSPSRCTTVGADLSPYY